jgi:hypothetical protein
MDAVTVENTGIGRNRHAQVETSKEYEYNEDWVSISS